MARVALDADVLIAFLEAAGVAFVPVDRAIARRAAQLRVDHPALRLPDAMSLAVALADDAELLTLDHRLQRVARDHRGP